MLFRILLTPRTDCLTTSCSCSSAPLSGCTPRTGHGPYSGCTRSSFLCGQPCAMGMIIWNPLKDTGAISTAALKICAVEFCFPKGRDAATALSLYWYLQQLYDSGTDHTPDTVSLCSSHQTRPRMPASVCLAALEVPSFVVGICVMGMISRNALQDTQPCNYKMYFFVVALWCCAPVSICYNYQTSS